MERKGKREGEGKGKGLREGKGERREWVIEVKMNGRFGEDFGKFGKV